MCCFVLCQEDLSPDHQEIQYMPFLTISNDCGEQFVAIYSKLYFKEIGCKRLGDFTLFLLINLRNRDTRLKP